MRTIVFIDLDHTYWSWGKVPESARQAVLDARANGHVVVANTSRTRGGSVGHWPEEFDGVCCGAGTDIVFQGKQLLFETLGMERAKAAFKSVTAVRRSMVMSEGTKRNCLYSRVPGVKAIARRVSQRFVGPGYTMGELLSATDEDFAEIQKYIVTFAGGTASKLISRFDLPEGLAAFPLRFAFEIADERFNKVTGMNLVREHLGTGWRTVAIGDSVNDIGMFQAADMGVAMGDSKPEVKRAADLVTDDLNHDGVLHAFQQLGLV